jgi:hypothetical protein
MRDWKLMAALLGLSACVILVALIGGLDVLLVIGGVIAGIGFLWLAFKSPVFFLVAALFIPQLKKYWPLQPIDQKADLTVAMLIGLAVGVAWMLMKYLARIDKTPRPTFSLIPRWPIYGFALFAAVVALSYSYTPAVSYGGTELVRFLGIGTLMLIAPIVIIRSERDLRQFVVLFLGAGCILALQMIIHLDDRQQAANPTGDITRIGAGWLMGMVILLALYFRPFQRDKFNTAAAWVLVPIFAFALIASAARGPITALLVVLILNLATSSKALSKIVIAVLLLGVSGYAAFAVFSRIDPGKYNAKLAELEDLAQGKATSGSAAVRIRYYRQTIAALPDHWFLGGGIGSWGVFYYGTDQRNYPHNLLLLIGFEEGIVGISALCVFLFAIGATSVRLLRKTGNHYAVFPSLVLFCFVVSMFSGDLDDNRILWYWTGVTLAICAMTASRVRGPVATRFAFSQRFRASASHLPALTTSDRLSSANQ